MHAIPDGSALLFPGPGGSLAGAEARVARHGGDLADQAPAAVAEDLFGRTDESPRFAQPAPSSAITIEELHGVHA